MNFRATGAAQKSEGLMGNDILKVLTEPTVDVELAGRVLGISRKTAYRARETGDIPSIKVGRQYRVPTTKLREMLGFPPQSPIAA